MLGCGRFRNLLTKSFVFETVSGVTFGHRQNFPRSYFFKEAVGSWQERTKQKSTRSRSEEKKVRGDSFQDHGIMQV